MLFHMIDVGYDLLVLLIRSNLFQDDESSLCGSSRWLAARNRQQNGGTRDETGLELVSCRHCIAQKAVNMFRGEIFGYAYYLQKNFKHDVRFYFSDVACRYWKWLHKIDIQLYENQTPAIGMLHVKGHPPACEVSFHIISTLHHNNSFYHFIAFYHFITHHYCVYLKYK